MSRFEQFHFYFFNRSPVDEVDEREIFKGKENGLILKQAYTHEFQCVFDLHNYPFDQQECFIDITTSTFDAPFLNLVPQNLTIKQKLEMTLFTLDSLDLRDENASEEVIRMTVFLRRRILMELMSTYLPSGLLLMITFATTFFKPTYFEAALTVNLTNMLVMTTIFTSMIEKLPLTSYVKMIDYWLIFCQLVPFTEVISIFRS